MTNRQTLIELTAIALNRHNAHIDRHSINAIAEEVARSCGENSKMWRWWTTTDMTARSWRLFCTAVIKQINDRRRQRPFEDLIVLDNSTARSGPKWW